MTYSAAIKEAYASAPADSVIIDTLEIYHPTWAGPVRLVKNRVAITATLEASAPNDPSAAVLFSPFGFTYVRPRKGDGRQELGIVVENATALLMPEIEGLDLSVATPVRVIYRAWMADDLSAPAMTPLNLQCRSMVATVDTVTMTCAYADFANLKFPRRVYRTSDFPGLDSRV